MDTIEIALGFGLVRPGMVYPPVQGSLLMRMPRYHPVVAFTDALMQERRVQRAQWGDDHDNAHTTAEWALIKARWLGRVAEAFEGEGGHAQAFDAMGDEQLQLLRDLLIQDAAIDKAIVDSIDRVFIARTLAERLNQ